jgi:serine/threonine-protein kinase
VADVTSAPTFTVAAGLPGPGSTSSAPSRPSDGGRFLPGQIVGERYRVIGLLGRGGMGEVYRADDLKLGQPVALKFLPEEFSRDEERLERFFNEVRTARQVTHPNVCRVHDLGEVGGQHFLSMEYVDGEDLRTLLRRIGRVPRDKAVQMGRQLCAGLAAAHDEGILHRDLKPANIMIDGRGRVRITDFGLAGLAETIEGGEIRAGTPAYQAPEQLAGQAVSRASDIYALGLVLYELFTGKPPFEASSAVEMLEMQSGTSRPSMTSLVEGLEDSIERIVQRCLEPDPDSRPPSALAVSAALPGGDPLAAALAAGETPSPEMVINADVEGALRWQVALALLVVILAGIGAEFGFRSRHSDLARVGLPKSPAELRFLARQVLDEVGHVAPQVDTAWGLGDSGYREWVEENDESPDRWDDLESVRPHIKQFWMRTSPESMVGQGWNLPVTPSKPALGQRGMSLVVLDAEGRLVELRIVPSEFVGESAAHEIDWQPLLDRAGLDSLALTDAPSRARPLLGCEQRVAWRADLERPMSRSLHVEACASAGSVVYFEVFAPWDPGYQVLTARLPEEAAVDDEESQTGSFAFVNVMQLTLLSVTLIGGLLLARRNIRLGRADRVGAFRLAVVLFVAQLVGELVRVNHIVSFHEIGMVFEAAAHMLLITMIAWAFYLGIEPFVRRLWPNGIITWRRILEGRIRDPLVGRDLLIGGAVAQIVILSRLRNAFEIPPPLFDGGPLEAISGISDALGVLLQSLSGHLVAALLITTLIVVARILLRKDWITWLVLTSFIATMMTLVFEIPPAELLGAVPFIVLIQGSFIFLVIRFGLAAVVGWQFWASMDDFVRVLDPSSWYFGYALFYLVVLIAPALYAFWISLGSRRLLRGDLLDV